MVHHEPDGPAARRGDDQRVDKAHVIAYQHRGPVLRNFFEPALVEPVDGVDQQPHQKPHQKFRHQCININCDQRIEQRSRQKQVRYRKAGLEHRDAEQGGSHHEQRIEYVVAGDDSRLMRRLAAALYQRIKRDYVETAEYAYQQQVGEQPPMRGVGGKRDHAVRGGACRRRRKIQVKREHRQAYGSERHQTYFDLVPRQFLAQQRAGADANRKYAQQQHVKLFIAAQIVARVQRKLR